MLNIAVLISGGGSNLQAIIDATQLGKLPCKIACVISDRPNAYGLERAKKAGITTYCLDRKKYKQALSTQIQDLFNSLDVDIDLIVLAGFLSILKGDILANYQGKIINIHPSLIPSFCGSGMYGLKVHRAVIDAGVKITGCTLHLVDEGTDTGKILLQVPVKVSIEDTAESLQKKVLKEEHRLICEGIKLFTN